MSDIKLWLFCGGILLGWLLISMILKALNTKKAILYWAENFYCVVAFLIALLLFVNDPLHKDPLITYGIITAIIVTCRILFRSKLLRDSNKP